ncbi:hypothetical protein MLD38_035093 [Melastoma candidum]|uniref:Uncharacterized protein n=1 Tax=Melastoma candidum TaxID=119954 RepID=A0ACB9MDQ6_9MYRT|nr:hypothetical protein MLD38_035093 [Melastoma candidum]
MDEDRYKTKISEQSFLLNGRRICRMHSVTKLCSLVSSPKSDAAERLAGAGVCIILMSCGCHSLTLGS